MMERLFARNRNELYNMCRNGKKLIGRKRYEECRMLVLDAMRNYPDAAEPHNMLGILLEKEGKHASAMKHFRAAYALDPTYAPARENLESFGTFQQELTCNYGDEAEEAVMEAGHTDKDIA